ncbi:MAG: J domain-containing protein [Myxococcales bacterium]|jgi:DnaJ-domain-containing protein 1|nr:J domain-containing protein [Myxococcales bacterium]
MRLPGRLQGTTLGDVLGALHRAGATGVLELIDPTGQSHRIGLEGGLIARVDSPTPSARLGEILEEQGSLPAGFSWRVARAAQAASLPTGKHLVERQVVSAQQISRALHEQARRRLERLFRLSDAALRFHVPRPRRRDVTEPPPLTAPEFLYGRPRARGAGGGGPRESATAVRSSGPWRVLGLPRGAGQEEVRRAFRRLAAEFHPDRFPRASEAERRALSRRLTELTTAYHQLLANFASGA